MTQENKTEHGSEPAFPLQCTVADANDNAFKLGQRGLSQRDYACIRLKVPKTGKPWLDELIREAKRDEFEMTKGAIIESYNQLRILSEQKGEEK